MDQHEIHGVLIPSSANPNGLEEANLQKKERVHAAVSRRRLAFRPPQIVQAKRPFVTEKDEISVLNPSSAEARPTTSSQQQDATVVGSTKTNPAPVAGEADKAKRIAWTPQEQSIFYEALKLHGKDFEAISKFMLKKKIGNKDREQVRNYYVNTFKVWRCKARIEDQEWAAIPRDARELFVLINGCEWRKRLDGVPFDQQKFKQLIMEGAVSFRPKGKKFIVAVKTPYCPALLKYFPYGKKNAEIPSHLMVRLKPTRNCDREFVVSREQNPFLLVQMNVNDKISSLFQLLKRKWSFNAPRMITDQTDLPMKDVGVRLFIDEQNQTIHNVLVEEEQNSSYILSLQNLKKDFEANNAFEADKTAQSPATSSGGKLQNEIKLAASSIKEVFEINEDKIRAGLTEDEVRNASMLQLYYMLGMKKELSFNYVITDQEPKFQSWRIFKSLIERDYDELMAKSMATGNSNNEAHQSTSALPDSALTIGHNRQNYDSPTNQTFVGPNHRSANLKIVKQEYCAGNQQQGVGVVERENFQFIRQLKEQEQGVHPRRPKRQIKLMPDKQRTFTRITAPPTFQQGSQIDNQQLCMRNSIVLLEPGIASSNSTAYVVEGGRIVPIVQQQASTPTTGNATDFTILQNPTHPSIAVMPSRPTVDFHQQQHPSTSAAIDLMSGDLSMDSTMTTLSQFHPLILANSPNSKSLPEDVRTAYEQMLKENSMDYCRQFEQLANMHQEGASTSPIKGSSGQKSVMEE